MLKQRHGGLVGTSEMIFLCWRDWNRFFAGVFLAESHVSQLEVDNLDDQHC